MRRLMTSLALVAALAFGLATFGSEPAQARRGSNVAAGVLVGALIGGIIAHEIYRSKRKRYIMYHGYHAPYYHGSSYYYHRPYRRSFHSYY